MPSLYQLPAASMLGCPFTDYLNVTVPHDYVDTVDSRVRPIVESLGQFRETMPGLLSLCDQKGRPTSSTFKLHRRGKVEVVSASGGLLAALRGSGAFGDYLNELAALPHRVSMLHATQDYVVDSPPSAILAFKEAAFGELLYLTRKRLLGANCKALLAVNASGDETGTVYLGRRANSDVWAKIYDKREERVSKGFGDPGPIVRVEVAAQSDVGATLRDAFNPHDLFFHFAGRSLVEAPGGLVPWVASGEGYVLGPRPEVLPLGRIARFVDFSHDLAHLVMLTVQAYPPDGGKVAADVLGRMLRKKCASAAVAVSELDGCASETSMVQHLTQ